MLTAPGQAEGGDPSPQRSAGGARGAAADQTAPAAAVWCESDTGQALRAGQQGQGVQEVRSNPSLLSVSAGACGQTGSAPERVGENRQKPGPHVPCEQARSGRSALARKTVSTQPVTYRGQSVQPPSL